MDKNAIYDNFEPDENYPETITEKVGYSELVLTNMLQNISRTIFRLSRLYNMLIVSDKDGENTLPDIITSNELRMALEPLLQLKLDIKDITDMLIPLYKQTMPQKEDTNETD